MNKYLENLRDYVANIHCKGHLLSEEQKEQAIDTIIEACEKAEKYDELQTPVRLRTEMNEHNATDYCCPKCNNVVQLYDNYCSKCSQRLVAFSKE